jgi:serine/threonine protein kinase
MATSHASEKDKIPSMLHCLTSSDAEIIAYCSDPPSVALEAIPLGRYGNTVIPLSDQEVVKYGPGVKIEEYMNLKCAYQLLDPSIVRVPRPYRFFQNGDLGYIVMEYMKGTALGELTDASRIEKVGKALEHFFTFRSLQPGPLGGGVSRGLLWSEGTTTEYSFDGSTERLEHWFNRRIKHNGLSLSFQECDFVLCHLDIAPRNIVWLHEDSLCIVDWASAGYYPRIFEWCLLDISRCRDGPFQDLIKKTMEPLTDWENENWELIEKAWANSIRYHLCVPPLDLALLNPNAQAVRPRLHVSNNR